MASSRRSRRRTSLFSRKIRRYSCLPVSHGGFLRANANRRRLISKRVIGMRISLFIYLHFFTRFRRSLIYSKLFFLSLRSVVIAHRWILDEYCNIFLHLLDENNFHGTNLKYKLDELFFASMGIAFPIYYFYFV